MNKVILDKIYTNFEEWVENVYIPQCDSLENKYIEGNIYVNVNQSDGARNATYVNVRKRWDNGPCSANDWQELYYTAPADTLSILGIDPIQVDHPSKHTWTISIVPEKL